MPNSCETAAGAPPPGMEPIPNHLDFAVLVNLCCCPGIAIPAIVYAAQVNARASLGDYAGARRCSRRAAAWCWGAVIAVIVLTFLCWFPVSWLFESAWRDLESALRAAGL